MKLVLDRCWLSPRATVGKLSVDGVFECFTCEDRYRPPPEPKVPKETCIPVGVFEVVVNHSPRFGVEMPLLLDVPDFAGIRIHTGNSAAHTDGCILVGRERDGEKLAGSREAYAQLFKKLKTAQDAGERITIDVRLSPHEGVSKP